jgi:hypothetical protein
LTESFSFKIDLSDQEAEILRKIRAKINQDGFTWSFEQILSELAAIGISNWSRMQLLEKITPTQDGFDV